MKEFTTSDLNLAAALMSEGYLLINSAREQDPKSRKFLFTIACTPEMAEKFQKDLLNGILIVNLREFLYKVKHLKGIIYGHVK